MKSLARFSVWWPKMDSEIEKVVDMCQPCQSNRSKEPKTPLNLWNILDKPWECLLHIDFAGPFEGYSWFIVIDAYSHWLEIVKMKSTTLDKVVKALRSLFAQYGVPKMIVSDNGPQFILEEYEKFCKGNGVTVVHSAPRHSHTNGMAERVIQTFKKCYLATKEKILESEHCLQQVLFTYRLIPHASTNRTTSELLQS